MADEKTGQRIVTFGIGGYDASKSHHNLTEVRDVFDDGTTVSYPESEWDNLPPPPPTIPIEGDAKTMKTSTVQAKGEGKDNGEKTKSH